MADALSDKINFELVSPEEKLASEKVRMVVVPGDDGDFAAMPGAGSVLSSLRPGVVNVYSEDQDMSPRRVFISGGFADVTAEQCTVLAEHADDVIRLEQSEIEKEIANLKEDLSSVSDKKAADKIKVRLEVAKAKLEAVLGKALTSI